LSLRVAVSLTKPSNPHAMKHKAHPFATPRKPQGQATRGKTTRNRLRRVDNFILRYDPALLHSTSGDLAGAFFVDLGYGAEPFTTLESAARFRRLNPTLPVLGVEIDPERVATAQPYADAQTCFRLGGFNLPLAVGADGGREGVRLIRAFNVLRQYEEAEVTTAYALLLRALLSGGLLIEGTSDPFGRYWVAHLLRRTTLAQASSTQTGCMIERDRTQLTPFVNLPDGWHAEALVFSINPRAALDLTELQAVLPKNLIHRMQPGEPIYDFFDRWRQALRETAAWQVWGTRQWFAASARRLAEAGYVIELHRRWLHHGYLIVYGYRSTSAAAS